MKQYEEPRFAIIEIETASSILTASDNHIVEDSAGFGEPTDEID